MALKILIVDPDKEWLSPAAEFFEKQAYEVRAVSNGRDAQLALYNDKYFAIILSHETQNHSADQVLKYIKSNQPSIKIVMLFPAIKAEKLKDEKFTDNLEKSGILEYFAKPIELPAIQQALEGHQSFGDMMTNLPKKEGVSDEEEVECADDKFTKIKIEEFYSFQAVLFDIFIRLNSGRYVKILHAGDTFSKERIDKYKNEKKVEYLYFYNTDRRKYVQFTNYLSKKIVKNKNIAVGGKVNMLQSVSKKYMEEVLSQGMKPQVIELGKEVCETVYNMIEGQDDLYKVLRTFQDFDPNAFSHSYSVTLFSSAIIKQFEWQSKATIESTALACMFHDIGKINLPPELLEKRPENMTEEELEQYRKHPELGAEIVKDNRMLNNVVKQVIVQHHERYDGTGFPFGFKGSKILTLANIVSLANDFVNMVKAEEELPVAVLRKMLSDEDIVKRYNSGILENFIKAFADPEKITKG